MSRSEKFVDFVDFLVKCYEAQGSESYAAWCKGLSLARSKGGPFSGGPIDKTGWVAFWSGYNMGAII